MIFLHVTELHPVKNLHICKKLNFNIMISGVRKFTISIYNLFQKVLITTVKKKKTNNHNISSLNLAGLTLHSSGLSKLLLDKEILYMEKSLPV